MHDVINPILVYVKLSRSMCGESGLRSESRGDATLKLVYVHHPLDDTSLLKYLPASMDCRGVRELEEFLVAQRHSILRCPVLMVFCVEEGSCLVFSNASGSSLPAVHFGKCCVAQNESVGWKDPLVQSIWNSMVDAKIIDCVSGCRLSASCLHHVYERSHCLGTRWCTNDDSCDHGECFILHVSSTAAFYMVSKEDPMQVPRLAPCTITTWGDALSVPIRMGAAEIHHLMGCILCNLRTGVQSVYVVYPRPDMMIRFSERSFLQEHRSSF